MKKFSCAIATFVLSCSLTMAQYNPDLWNVLDETEQIAVLTGLYQANGIQESGDSVYTKTWDCEELTVHFEYSGTGGKNYNNFSLQFMKWKGGGVDGSMTGKYFTKDTSGINQTSDIAIGYTVDMTDEANRYVSMDVQTSDELNLRIDLGDIAGKISNASSPNAAIAKTIDNTVWTPILFSWNNDSEGLGADGIATEIADQYTDDWWNIGSTNDYDDRKCSYLRGGVAAKVPMDVGKIVKVVFTIDYETEVATDKILKIKNIKVGTGFPGFPDFPSPCGITIETISGALLEVVMGVIYSAGAITVTNVAGQVVKVADKTLEISSLPAGVLVITAAEGTAKIIK